MPQVTSSRTIEAGRSPTGSSPRPKLVRATTSRLRVGSARDRAQLESACPRLMATLCATMRLRLSAVQAAYRGESKASITERFNIPQVLLDDACAIVDRAGAEVFLSMLERPEQPWVVPEPQLPALRRRRSSGQHGLSTPPVSPTELRCVAPEEASKCVRKPVLPSTPPAEPCAVEALCDAQLQEAKAGIEAFRAQDPELFTPPTARPALNYFEYVRTLPPIDQVDVASYLWMPVCLD